jgi:hypothetical protein
VKEERQPSMADIMALQDTIKDINNKLDILLKKK